MRYTKPPLSFEKQAELLISRGLEADKDGLVAKLRVVNYYRLSGYWYPFRHPNTDTFKPNATIDKIWRRYTFDRQLRLLTMDAIERIEIAIKTSIIYHHSHSYGAFGYTAPIYLPNLDDRHYSGFMDKIKEATLRSKEAFVEHFKKTYGDTHSLLPIWMAAEIMTFGMMLTMFRGIEMKLQQTIAREYNISDKVLLSWLVAINTIRNVCAHHGRLRDRVLDYTPMIPRANKYPEWHSPVGIPQDRIFGILTILKYMMNIIAPQSGWSGRFKDLLDKYQEIPIASMGMPDNWCQCPIWDNKTGK
ncbi:MAG: Abi family protein [Sedimentisphaerales bacterium]